MNRKQFVIVAVGMIVAAFAGGMVGNLTAMRAAHAAGDPTVIDDLKARKITLVNQDDKTRARLFIDSDAVIFALYDPNQVVEQVMAVGKGRAILQFGAENPKLMIGRVSHTSVITMTDDEGRIIWNIPPIK